MIFTKGLLNAVAEDGTTSSLDVLISSATGSSSTVTVTPNLTSGTLVGTITVDGTSYSLYAPSSSGSSSSGSTVSVTRNLTSGTEVGTITVDGTAYVLYAPTDTNTTYSSKTAASGGTDVSLVTTGEKYTWNNKSNLTIGTTSTTAAAGDHTHSQYLTSSSTLDATKLSGTIPDSCYSDTTYTFSVSDAGLLTIS